MEPYLNLTWYRFYCRWYAHVGGVGTKASAVTTFTSPAAEKTVVSVEAAAFITFIHSYTGMKSQKESSFT